MTSYYKRIQNERIRKDLTGIRFGRLVVTGMNYENNEKTTAVCKCDCGNEIHIVATYLTSGDTLSCGCLQKERASESNTKDFTGYTSECGVELVSRHSKNKNGQWLWVCRCFCGNEFIALPAKVKNGHITSCGCARRSSRERLISSVLDTGAVTYIQEYRFNECADVRCLPFDFYLPEHNTVIEYQGEQHYNASDFFGGDSGFALLHKHDLIKRQFCRNKNIQLVELPYTMTNEEITKTIQTLFIRRDCNG